jgi:hypothetical protein
VRNARAGKLAHLGIRAPYARASQLVRTQSSAVRLIRLRGLLFAFDKALHVGLLAGLHLDGGALFPGDRLLADRTDRFLALGLLGHEKTSALGLDFYSREQPTAEKNHVSVILDTAGSDGHANDGQCLESEGR